ncbi:MAG TPA: trigger factor [Gammaproteobacteria bacterium]|nr:trigger factor [Gammaproteobacteria bacterium]
MQVSVEAEPGLTRRMKVQIPAEQVDQQVESKLQQLARSVRLDGFRPGKVPISVVRKRYGEQVRLETADELIASTYQEALQQQNLQPVGEPDIEPTRNEPGQPFEYVAVFDVYPEVEPPDLSDLVVERPVTEITDADVDTMLEKLRRQRMTWQEVEREARQGDRLDIDFEGRIDGEPFPGNSAAHVPLELGSDTMIPGFEEQLVGARPGETRSIEVTFPDDYGSKEVAGKTATFEVKVNTVSEPVLPALDDEFARAFGVGDGGLEALRAEVRRNMERELEVAVKAKVKQQVFDALLERADVDVPASLVDSEVEALIKKQGGDADTDTDRDRAALEEEAKRRVALGLLIAEIVKRNQLQVDPEQVRSMVESIAASYEKPDEVVQWYYSNPEMLGGIQTYVLEDTVVEWVVDHAKVDDKSKTFEEIMQS